MWIDSIGASLFVLLLLPRVDFLLGSLLSKVQVRACSPPCLRTTRKTVFLKFYRHAMPSVVMERRLCEVQSRYAQLTHRSSLFTVGLHFLLQNNVRLCKSQSVANMLCRDRSPEREPRLLSASRGIASLVRHCSPIEYAFPTLPSSNCASPAVEGLRGPQTSK